MSKRSPFWQPFATQTPLGYKVAGHFNTEPGPSFGALRFTHVDGPLPRPFVSPSIPLLPQPPREQDGGIVLPARATTVDLRAVERLDGTPIAFYPLFDSDGSLVEVVPRTRDSVVVADTPWRSLATLVGQARHAGIEEAVRRQRGVFVFQLVGSANPRLVSYPFRLRLVLYGVLRGTGRVFATALQMRSWSNQYGLDLPATYTEFDPTLDSAALSAQATDTLRAIDTQARDVPPGRLISSGMVVWISERSGASMLDIPADLRSGAGANPIVVWDAMARLADQGIAPTPDRVATALAGPGAAGSVDPASLDVPWERWSHTYPQAFPDSSGSRIAV